MSDTEIEKQEHSIADDHEADVQNGLTEAEATESDKFERRVLGMDEPDEEIENHDGPTFKRGRCTRCKRTSDYCEC